MSYFIVDVETDGPIPFFYSMVSFGAILVEPTLTTTFYGKTKPVSEQWIPEALAISGVSREEHFTFNDPRETMKKFKDWVMTNNKNGRPIFMSDNLAFDWQWINFYFIQYLNENPFGYSGRRIGDIWAGIKKDMRSSWKYMRKTKHTHNPVDDAKGNAEAFLEICKLGGISLR